MFTQDLHNNVGRHCSIRGHEGRFAHEGRAWRVKVAVTGGKYLVRHVTSGKQMVVSHRDMSNLY